MQCLLIKQYLFTIFFQLLYLGLEVFSTIAVLDKGLMPLEKNSVGIQFYIDVENKERLSACNIATWGKDCCLSDIEEDCNTMQVYGGQYTLAPKDTDTIVFVYPTLYQHDQIGYCDFILEYKCGRRRRSKRLNVKVPFDTKVLQSRRSSNILLAHYIDGKMIKSCDSADQDSLNNCEPVNCNLKYGGERPFYDANNDKCVEASLCVSDPDEELPDIVYVPNINSCRDLDHPLTIADIFAISTGAGVVKQAQRNEDVTVELKFNCTTISQNLNFLRDLMNGNLFPVWKTDTTDYKKCCKSALYSILGCIMGVSAVVLSFICCIQSLIWLHKKIKTNEFGHVWENFRSKFRSRRVSRTNNVRVNSEVRNALLREVIVKDIPLELRDSIVDICHRMDRKVKRKNRYRREDVGSQFSLNKVEYEVRTSTATSSSSFENCDEQEKLLK